jgi:hypothetical protein
MCCQFLLNAYCSAFSVLSCQSVLSASHTCLVKRFLSGFFATIVANLHLSSPLHYSSTVLGSRFSVLVTDCRSTSSLLPSRIRSTTFPCLVCVCRSAFSLLPSRARSTTFTCNGGVYLCPHGMWGRDTRLPGWVVVPYIKTQFNMTCVAFGLTSGFGF